MTHWKPVADGQGAAEKRLEMLYGVNQADQCWDFALGAEREHIWSMLRDIDTRMIRLFLFDKGAPDPVTEWPTFTSYVQAVLNVGATPMITFAKLHRPLDDPRAIRWFVNQCSDVVWGCIEQWGPEVVREWYWCVWNEPNNAWISGDVSFEQYRRLYEGIAIEVKRWLDPYLDGRRPKVGGPAVEGFQPFWMDWVWRFVNEIDNSLIGFLDWHCYGDWRDYGENGAPSDPVVYRELMMSKTSDYGLRARAVGEILAGRDIENICGELNAHSHYTTPVREHFNHSVFGATFYTSAVLHLMRAGVDAEMFWTGTEDEGGYGMMTGLGDPRPAFHAKRLCAQHIRRGDWVSFPLPDGSGNGLDAVVARGDDGRLSALLVHLREGSETYDLNAIDERLGSCRRLLKIDATTGNEVLEQGCNGTVAFDGYGVAVVTNAPGDTDLSHALVVPHRRVANHAPGRGRASTSGRADDIPGSAGRSSPLAVVHSTISTESLRDFVLEHFELEVDRCGLLRTAVNDTYLLESQEGRCIARVYGFGSRNSEDISYETDLLRHLTSKGVSVSAPISGRNGRFIHSLAAPEGARSLVLFSYAVGRPLSRDDEAKIYNTAGRLAAQLHTASDDFVTEHRRSSLNLEYLIDAPLVSLRTVLAQDRDEWRFLDGFATRLRKSAEEATNAGLDWGPCHGDLDIGNFHVDDDGTLTIFDFESCGCGWRAYDFEGIRRVALRCNEPIIWTSFLDGYRETRELGALDLEAMNLFHAICRFHTLGVHAKYFEGWGTLQLSDPFLMSELSFFRQWEAEKMPR